MSPPAPPAEAPTHRSLSRIAALPVYVDVSRKAIVDWNPDHVLARVMPVVARLVRCPQEREDIAQESLARLLRAQRNGSDVKNPEAFARQTAVRLAIDALRSRQRERAHVKDGLALGPGLARSVGDGIPAATTNPKEAPSPEDVRRLYDAIAALPEMQSAVITLRKLLELDYTDVAEVLGLSVENCRSHCRHGLARLRAVLTEPR